MKSTRVDGKRSLARSGYLLIWSIRLPGGFSITSTCFFCNRSTRELSFGTIWISTVLTFGFLPYQYGFACNSTLLSFCRRWTRNGPLPTGLLKNFVTPWAVTSFLGTIAYAYIARSASNGACGSLSLMTSVFELGAGTLLTESSRKPQPPLKCIER